MTLSRLFILRSPDIIDAMSAFIRANAMEMARQGKPLAVQVSEFKAKRNTEQNKRLHAVLQEIADKAWVNGRQYDMETWKEFFKCKLIGSEEIAMPDGSVIQRGLSTTTLNVHEFADFMTNIEQYAASELGVRFEG